jgi:hypothetical protein
MESAAAQAVLMYFVLPAWLAVGFADYLLHRSHELGMRVRRTDE